MRWFNQNPGGWRNSRLRESFPQNIQSVQLGFEKNTVCRFILIASVWVFYFPARFHAAASRGFKGKKAVSWSHGLSTWKSSDADRMDFSCGEGFGCSKCWVEDLRGTGFTISFCFFLWQGFAVFWVMEAVLYICPILWEDPCSSIFTGPLINFQLSVWGYTRTWVHIKPNFNGWDLYI